MPIDPNRISKGRPYMSSGPRGRLDGIACLAIAGTLVCWSSTPIWIKYLADYFDPFSQNLYRYAFALLFWLPFLVLRQWTGRVPRSVWALAIAPTVANTLMQTFWAWSLYYLDAGVMALLARTTVIWSALLSIAVFADERRLARSGRFWIGLLCGLIGAVGVLAYKPGFNVWDRVATSTDQKTLIGAVMVLVAAFLWSVYAVMVRLTMRGTDPRTAFAVIALETTAGCAAIAVACGTPDHVLQVPWRVILVTALSGWICIALAHVCYYTAIQRIGVAVPAAVLQLTPFAVVCLSYFIFRERFTSGQLAGGVVIVLGSALALWAQGQLGPRATGAAEPGSRKNRP